MVEPSAPGRLLPPDLLMGCASAAHQVEGGLDNDWTEMERTVVGAIQDGSVSGLACDHYHRYVGDLETAAAMGNTAHRFSVEWSRIEPVEGVVDREALHHYRDVVLTCRRLGMEPVVTLLHFTLPRWLAERGGLCSPDAPRCFARFAAVVAETLTPHVSWWITLNEPSVHATMAYLFGAFPPRNTSLIRTRRAINGLLDMHAAAAQALRGVGRRTGHRVRVSIAHHERRLRPMRPGHSGDRLAAVLPNYLFNRWFLDSCQRGRRLPPFGHGQRLAGDPGLDYIGVNYYCEESIRLSPNPTTLFSEQQPLPGYPLDDLGNTINPDGLRSALMDLWERYRLPLMVTENGVSEAGDRVRPGYIVAHLHALLDARDAGADVRGYLYWTQMDNFEWAMGYTQHFGLFAVDRETLERIPRLSAQLFGEICQSRRVPPRESHDADQSAPGTPPG